MKYILGIILAVSALSATAAQTIKVVDGGSYKIKVSASDMTRITMGGGARIEEYRGKLTAVEVKIDQEAGDVYLHPRPGSGVAAFSFFIKDSYGNVYSLVAEQHQIPSETVILVSSDQQTEEVDKKSEAYITKIKDMIRFMAGGKESGGYYRQAEKQELVLWKETRITLVESVESGKFQGLVFLIENLTEQELVFSEKEFKNLVPNVLAASMEKLAIEGGGVTRLYLVTGGAHGF